MTGTNVYIDCGSSW